MIELAVAAVALISRIFAPVTSQIADEAADAAGSKIKDLYNKIRQKFHKGSYDGNLLDGVEESPADKDRQDALAKALAKQLEADPSFHESVKGLVESISALEGTNYQANVTARDSGFVSGRDINVKAEGDVIGRDSIRNYGPQHYSSDDDT